MSNHDTRVKRRHYDRALTGIAALAGALVGSWGGIWVGAHRPIRLVAPTPRGNVDVCFAMPDTHAVASNIMQNNVVCTINPPQVGAR